MAEDQDRTIYQSSPGTPPGMALCAGSRLGDYVLERFLGAGAMGEVFQARHTKLDKVCALKILPPALAEDEGFRKRFETEGRALAKLEHPGIVRVFNAGESCGRHFIAMEYLSGGSLEDRLKAAGGRIQPCEAASILMELLEALSSAHENGIVHRDIKPANLLFDAKGRCRIGDFGLALLAGDNYMRNMARQSVLASRTMDATLAMPSHAVQVDALAGTVDYMSPEVRAGRQADARSDIYALGVVAYMMLTGRKPLGLARAPSALVPGLSKAWDLWVARCMEQEPGERFQSAAEALKLLPACPERQHRFSRPMRALAALGAALYLFIGFELRGMMGLVELVSAILPGGLLVSILLAVALQRPRLARAASLLFAGALLAHLLLALAASLSFCNAISRENERQRDHEYVQSQLEQAEEAVNSARWEDAEALLRGVLAFTGSNLEQQARARDGILAVDEGRNAAAISGGLLLRSLPDGALASVDNGPSFALPGVVKGLAPGLHMLRISLDGYRSVEEEVLVLSEKVVELHPFVLEPALGSLLLESEPEGMNWEFVSWPGESPPPYLAGNTPAILEGLPVGDYVIMFSLGQQQDHEQLVRVEDGRMSSLLHYAGSALPPADGL